MLREGMGQDSTWPIWMLLDPNRPDLLIHPRYPLVLGPRILLEQLEIA